MDCNYKNGKLEGKYYKFYNNGNKRTERSFKNGKSEGEYKYFIEDNELYQHWIFKDGERIKRIIR